MNVFFESRAHGGTCQRASQWGEILGQLSHHFERFVTTGTQNSLGCLKAELLKLPHFQWCHFVSLIQQLLFQFIQLRCKFGVEMLQFVEQEAFNVFVFINFRFFSAAEVGAGRTALLGFHFCVVLRFVLGGFDLQFDSVTLMEYWFQYSVADFWMMKLELRSPESRTLGPARFFKKCRTT